jgi:hypothetical protein
MKVLMSLYKIIFFSCFLGSVSLAQRSGGDVGNGGGFALCQDGRYYSYDLLITSQIRTQDRQVSDTVQNLQFIYSQLKRLQDPLAEDFKEFFATMYKQIPGNRFQWFVRSNLPLLWEPGLDSLLPSQCGKRKQAATYFDRTDSIPYASYTYDRDFIAQVNAQPGGPLQVSYLWVHEWLWNHFRREQFQNLAVFNRLLHSQSLGTMSAAEYLKYRPQVK